MWIHVLIVLVWLLGWVLLFRIPRLPLRVEGDAPLEGTEPVTIVIPARNEASSLPNLLGDLAERRPPGCRVIVVNDGSEDDTAGIARSHDFVEVIDAEALRDGWLGKTWACHTGASRVETGTLVFLDADVRVQDEAIARAIALRAQRGGLLTIWPYHRVERPYEHLSSLFNTVSMMVTGTGSLLPPHPPRAGFGPFMVTTKEDYLGVGGHEAVKSSVIEDFALTRLYSEADLPVTNLGGGRDVSFRMYPDGFRSLLQGWTKNFGPAMWKLPVGRLLAVITWVTFAFGVLKWGGGVDSHVLPRVYYGFYAVQMLVMFRQVGSFSPLCALLYPLQILLLMFILLRSFWRVHVRGSVTWRGRQVPMASSS